MDDLEKKGEGTEIQDDEEINDDDSEESENEDTETEEEEWMKEDDESDQTDETVPLRKLIKTRRKFQGRLSERDEEIEALKTKVSELEAGKSKPLELPKRPRRADFEDEDAYEAELDKYEEEKDDIKFRQLQQTNDLRSSQEKTVKKIETAVNAHYDRAEDLKKSSGITAEAFQAADLAVREAVEAIRPKQGDAIVDQFVARLGKGSEKVFYKLGRSKALRGEFIALLAEDPSGLDAATFLGEQKALLINTKRKASNAPPPDTQLKGDETAGQKEKALKKRYSEAHKEGDGQKAWNAKKEAKAAGIDTSKW